MLVLARLDIQLAGTEYEKLDASEDEYPRTWLAMMTLLLWRRVYHFLVAGQPLSACDRMVFLHLVYPSNHFPQSHAVPECLPFHCMKGVLSEFHFSHYWWFEYQYVLVRVSTWPIPNWYWIWVTDYGGNARGNEYCIISDISPAPNTVSVCASHFRD